MKTNFLQMFFAMIISLSMIACNNMGGRDNENDNDTTALNNDNDNGGMLDNNQNKDQDFMEEAAYGGLMEVELGRYAQQNAQNPRVKNFAAMMVKDHSKANDELKALAAQKNVTIPTALDDKHMDKMNDIKEKRGAEFDKAYMNEMVDDHEKDVDKFKRQAENGNDSDVKAFAAKTLPILLMHQDSAKQIKDFLK
jgi:putative membrane protein